MNLNFAIMTAIISVIITSLAISIASIARARAKDEIYKRKIAEKEYRHSKSMFAAKETMLISKIEARDIKIEQINSEMKVIELQHSKSNKLAATEELGLKYLIEAKDNKIDAQNAKILMLQADCARFKNEISKLKNNNEEENSSNKTIKGEVKNEHV